jgi:hypothetical protein
LGFFERSFAVARLSREVGPVGNGVHYRCPIFSPF